MTHLVVLDGDHYQKVKDGLIHFLVVKCEEKIHKVHDDVFIQGKGHEDELRTHITFVSKDNTKGVQKGYRIINIENK